jgi:hypothetical protein
MLSAFVQPFPLLYSAFLLTHAGLGALTSVSFLFLKKYATFFIHVQVDYYDMGK